MVKVMQDISTHTTPSRLTGQEANIWLLLEEVTDPEVPVLSILDLGIVRSVKVTGLISAPSVEITITPTYSGCPAMDMIALNIKIHLRAHGYPDINIINVLSPAWTTDWMTENGKAKLRAYGIAAPYKLSESNENDIIYCPQCNSENTKLLSQFGSTACKALYQCIDCKEPFDYFKCH